MRFLSARRQLVELIEDAVPEKLDFFNRLLWPRLDTHSGSANDTRHCQRTLRTQADCTECGMHSHWANHLNHALVPLPLALLGLQLN